MSAVMNAYNSRIELIKQPTKSEFALNRFFSLSSDLLSISGQDGYFQQLNPAWEKALGWTLSQLRSQPSIEFVHPDDLAVTLNAEERCQSEGIVEYENRYRRQDGSYIWLFWRKTRTEQGIYYAIAKEIKDYQWTEISQRQAMFELESRVQERTAALQQVNKQLNQKIAEQQQTAEALRHSEEQFRRVFDEAPIGMSLTGWDDRYIRVNRAFFEMLGYTESELMALTFKDITHPEDLENELPSLDQVRKGIINSFKLEKRYLKKNQEILWVNLTLMVLRDEGGEVLYDLAMVEDITERKLSEEALLQSQARYRAIVEDQTELICRFRLNLTLTFVNEAYCRYFGKQQSELIDNSFMLKVFPEDHEVFKQAINSLSKKQPIITHEHRAIMPSGEIRWQQWTNRALFNEHGKLIEFQAAGRDITPLKQAEAEMRKALAKERELSELRSSFVSLVSHEFRTPLTTILSSSELLQRYNHKLSDEKKFNHHYRIRSAVLLMTQLLDEVLTIGKAEAGQLRCEPALMDLVAFCTEVVESMQIGAKNQQELLLRVIGEPKEVQMDERLLRHILTNLLSNAMKYSPEGKKIQFDLSYDYSEVVFRIKDSGIGIPEEDLRKLFNAFRRASNVGTIQGTGLGLAIVKRCVDLHAGEIFVESEEGLGTTFTVKLPYG
ncbi:MAG: PAS domain S-box protein [Symploca sp. SIO2E9]|nr:PAS domain S-box protein [Symploca sp. SIO2E9]